MKKTILIISCEHASDHIPQDYCKHLAADAHILNSFAALDIYAKELTQEMVKEIKCDHIFGNISRFILDLNKNPHHDHCFSTWAQNHLSSVEKKELLNQYYHPYRQQLIDLIQNYIQKNLQIIHLSIHTFSPISKGQEHNAAIGILYDPHRHGEKEVARIWHELLIKRTPFRVRLNYPRTGKSDNLTSYLRKQFAEKDYLGLEIECNASLLEKESDFKEYSQELIHSMISLMELL